jgi:hypothetical protein
VTVTSPGSAIASILAILPPARRLTVRQEFSGAGTLRVSSR